MKLFYLFELNYQCDFLFIFRGKRDEKLILPVNSSVSVTLSQNQVSIYIPPVYPKYLDSLNHFIFHICAQLFKGNNIVS